MAHGGNLTAASILFLPSLVKTGKMKSLKLILLILVASLSFGKSFSQNAMNNILTQNSGVVKKGNTVFLEVSITNTDPWVAVGAYKIKAQINVPPSIVILDNKSHVLADGWTILNSS